MFEVVISNTNTGRVWRRLFDTREEADQHTDRFLDQSRLRPRNRRNYRVEVFYRELPQLRQLTRPVEPCVPAA